MANVIAQSGQGGTASASLIRQWTETGGDPNSYYGVWTDYYEEYTLTATPETGYSFQKWTGVNAQGISISGSNDNPFTLSLYVKTHDNEGDYIPSGIPRTYTANFTRNRYTVTIAVTPGQSARGTVSGSGTYEHGSSCTATATANQGWQFDHWETANGTVVSSSNPYTFTVTESVTLYAVFTKASTYQLLHGSSNTLLHGSSGTLLHDA